MSTDLRADIRASRFRIARSRGALSGLVLLILGLWAAIVPFIGPYFDFAFTPAANSAWHWTSARLYLDVLPGAAAFFGGLLLLFSASRVTTSFGAWLAAAGGAWLVVGPVLAGPIGIQVGSPDPSSGSTVRALEQLFFFFAIGAAIVFVAATALGRVSVHSIRDVRVAQRRSAGREAAAAETERREAEARESEGRDAEQRQATVQQPNAQQPNAQQPNAQQPNVAPPNTGVPPATDAGPHTPQHYAPPPGAAPPPEGPSYGPPR